MTNKKKLEVQNSFHPLKQILLVQQMGHQWSIQCINDVKDCIACAEHKVKHLYYNLSISELVFVVCMCTNVLMYKGKIAYINSNVYKVTLVEANRVYEG